MSVEPAGTEEAGLPAWLEGPREAVRRMEAAGRLPHALLITGPPGIGKRRLAREIARSRLCGAPGLADRPCGRCRACRQLAAGTHPDYRELAPETDRGERKQPVVPQIKIDAVRALCAELALTSQYGGARVALLHPAEALTRNAANALLKTLEEPGPGALIVLVSARPGAVPVTVRSRCQRLACAMPDRASAAAWLGDRGVEPAVAEAGLHIAEGAPYRALEALRQGLPARREGLIAELLEAGPGRADPVTLAAAWDKEAAEWLLAQLRAWLRDALRLRLAPAAAPALVDGDLGPLLARRLVPLGAQELFALDDKLNEARALLDVPGTNRRLLLEEVLVTWVAATEGGSKRGRPSR